ncbi:MAG: right-handed parallel beta-helix repeat-containing protein, partial [Verrucomicrobiota bacterium]
MPPQTKHAATTSPSPGDRTSIAWIVCLGALLAGSGNANAMDVSGQQSGVWRQADSPIRVIGTVEVAAGAVLTIEPGTVILVNGYYSSINVRGTLNASGTASEAIVFTSIADSGGNQWGGIYFYPGSTGVVQHAEFRYGGGAYITGMIQIDEARVTVQNVIFRNSSENGLHVSNINDPQRVVIQQCAFADNANSGIQCDTASPTIVGCSFTNNGATAIRLTGTSSPDFNGDLTAPTDGIHLSGATLEANAHWEYAGIPYILDGTIEVPTNTSLTIAAGVVIKGSGYYNRILIRGQLWILGTSAQPVFLTSSRDDTIAGDTNGDGTNSVPAGDQWGGIYFYPGSTGVVQHA